jgi:hypothetical protein
VVSRSRFAVVSNLAGSIAAAALGLLESGCRPDRPSDRTEPSTIYLVAQRYQPAGDPSTLAVPTAVVGGERRIVLANPPAPETLSAKVEGPPGGELLILTVSVPERMRGNSIHLAPKVPPACAGAVVGLDPAVVTAPKSVIRARVRLGEKQTDCGVEVTARPGPERSYASGPIQVPAAASLRVATGIEDDRFDESTGVRFAVTVIDGQAETSLLEIRSDSMGRRWTDHEVDLSAFAGRTVRLRFDAEADFPAYPVWGDPAIVVKRREPKPLNVLLISLDTLSADHLGCYGYKRQTSPTIDAKMAAQGTLFERAYSQYPQTIGSHMTMLTGLYPCAHGLPGPKGTRRKLGDVRTLPELLRAAGYRTGAVTENGYVNAATGFARGFGSFTGFTELTPKRYPAGMVSRTFGDGLRWITRERDRPWFLFLHTYEVHEPYDPPQKDLERVAAQTGPYHLADLYDGEIRHTDTALAQLLAALKSAGLIEKTLIILTSDHGEQFGQHGAWQHSNTLYNAVLHVPLILRAPGVPAGRRIGDVVGLVDLLPTVLDVVGLPPHPTAQGRSFAPLWRGESLPARTLYAEEHTWYLLVAAFAPPHKWIFSTAGGKTQAFDLLRDPDETRDLAETIGERGEPLLAEFRSLCAANAREAPLTESLDPDVEEKLRALGYVE